MPDLGEIRKAGEINRPGTFQYIWAACSGCGKERWVVSKKGVARNLRCNSCAGRAREEKRERAPINLTPEARELIIGSTLADSWIGIPPGHTNPCLICGHRIEDIEYLKWKYAILQSVGLIKWRIYYRPYGLAVFHTIAHPVLWEFRNLFYPNGHKTVSEKVLEQVTPLALAVWHMDDGYFLYNSRGMRIELSKKAFPKAENQLVCDWLKAKFDISSRVRGKVFITKASEAQKFVDVVSSYIHPCMMRKIGYGWKWQPANLSELNRRRAIQRWQRVHALLAIDDSLAASSRDKRKISLRAPG